MTDLVLLGAGGSSREIAGAVADLNARRPTWNLLGFLDDSPVLQGSQVDGLPVLGLLDAAARFANARFVLGIAGYPDLALRARLVERLGLGPDRFATLVHPSASVSPRARLGSGTAALQGVVITSGAQIGSHVLLTQGCLVAHDCRVGDFTAMASAAVLNGGVEVGECVYIGSGAVVGPGVRVGRGAIVGIGAVVVRDVPPGCSVFGNPARIVNAPGELRRHRW